MLSIAEWTDKASALSSQMKLTSSASFSPSIRISLRLKIHQAQAKNFVVCLTYGCLRSWKRIFFMPCRWMKAGNCEVR